MKELEGKIAIVTGASSGIGMATARRFLAAGARVALFARSGEPMQALEREATGSALAVVGDVSDESAIERLFAAVEERFGACDIVVNNAGMIEPARLIDTSRATWDQMFAVNVTGAYLVSRRALPGMIARGSGNIINVASISGVMGTQKFPGFVSYAASKAALIGFTEALAAEVREEGIRVNAISPGSVPTATLRKANPALSGDMSTEEVAESILFLATEKSRPYNGQNLHVYSV